MSAPPSLAAPVTEDEPTTADQHEAAEPGRPDPAATVVPIGEIPPLDNPVRPATRLRPAAPTDRARGWVVTGVLTLVAAMVRLVNLGGATDGGTPLFDEKYYAIQAWEMLRNGGVEDNQAFGVVVHPPLGKQLIAIGEWLLGYNATGWRLASAVAGIVSVLLIIRVTRRMTGSTLLGGIAGVLLICDGVSHVQSRSALLDIFQAVFVLAAFTCLIADRDQVRARLAAAVSSGATVGPSTHWSGIALGARWWRFGTGVLLGLTTAVKWSGAYWILAFVALSLIWDMQARRESGIRRPVRAGLRRDLLPTIWSLAVVPVLVYVGSWWAWFASETSWPRHTLVAIESNRSDWKSGLLYELASLWQNTLWQWTWKMLDFHAHLLTPTDPTKRHPWESKPWTWPLGTRPVLYYSPADAPCGDGTATECVRRVFLIGTPALWWISLFVLGWALWKAIGRLDWRYAAVLVAYGAGYLPWFTNLDRQMYYFYATPLAPFLVIGITLALGDILGRRGAGIERRLTSVAVVAVYVGLVVANFIWLWPILNGEPITHERLTMQTWLPSWG
ncbi:MAG TPA: phospholipid carrier-dependent glycosyltransferase [Nakamurella sp.]